MICQRCGSSRILEVSSKPSDCCDLSLEGHIHVGYVPYGLGIGGGDYIEFNLCLNCGQLQGNFPIGEASVNDAFPPVPSE